MKNYEIIDNINVATGDKLKYLFKNSTNSLSIGIGYFKDSGFEKIKEPILDAAEDGSIVRIIAGNLYAYDTAGEAVINLDLDIETCQLIIDLLDSKKIQIKSVKENFFHGKFFLGFSNDSSYLLTGSSNMTSNGLSKDKNIEYNIFIEDLLTGEIAKKNKDWFEFIWNDKAVELNNVDVEMLKFLIRKYYFNVQVEEVVLENGESKKKTELEIKTEIIASLLRNIGVGSATPKLNKAMPVDDMVRAVFLTYEAYKDFKSPITSEMVHEIIEDEEMINDLKVIVQNCNLKEYYYRLAKEYSRDNIRQGSTPSYDIFIVDVVRIFSKYYEEFYLNNLLKRVRSLDRGEPKNKKLNAKPSKITVSEVTFQRPESVSDNKFEFLLKSMEKIKGNFSDEWLFQYQAHDSQQVLRMHKYKQKGAYIAHEAGMGKSAIMGKFIKEALVDNPHSRILLACPSSLLYQWKEDNLLRDFGLSSQIVDREVFQKYDNKIWTSRKINIVSIDFLKNIIGEEADNEYLEMMSPDILIIDECHNIKNEDAIRFQNISKLRAKFVLLASATPLQNNIKEFLVQLKLIDPEIDITNTNMEYVMTLRDKYLIRKTRTNDLSEIKTIKQAVRKVIDYKVTNTDDFKKLYDELEDALRNGGIYYYSFLGELKDNKKYEHISKTMAFTYLQQITSSVSACMDGLKRLKTKIEAIVQNDLSSLRKEDVKDFESIEERDILNSILDYKENITEEHIERLKEDIGLLDLFLSETDGLFYKDGQAIRNPKEEMLLDLFATDKVKDKQCIIFVKYKATGELLKEFLSQNGYNADFFTGDLSKQQRDEVVKRFRSGESNIFIATDAANAGLNLQNSDFLINYDLNWNPMIVEQRIGRVHRIGQKSDEVTIYNLILEDTVDSRIQEQMKHKIETFDTLFISSDEILGKIAQTYFSGESSNGFILPDFENDKSELKEVLKTDAKSIKKVNTEYVYSIEALRKMLMWILNKYNIQYHTKDFLKYNLKLDNGEIYEIELSQIYNIIEEEHEFFKEFDINTFISNMRRKEVKENLDGMYLTKENLYYEKAIEKVQSLEVDSDIKSKVLSVLEKNNMKELIQLNLEVKYNLLKENEQFTDTDLKSVLICSDKSIISDEDVIKILSVLPSVESNTQRVDNLKDKQIYFAVYNNLLPRYLGKEKVVNLSEFNVDIEKVKLKIVNASILKID